MILVVVTVKIICIGTRQMAAGVELAQEQRLSIANLYG